VVSCKIWLDLYGLTSTSMNLELLGRESGEWRNEIRQSEETYSRGATVTSGRRAYRYRYETLVVLGLERSFFAGLKAPLINNNNMM
jgi:hypothetical protein